MPPLSQIARVNSPTPANGMNIRESKIEAAKEGLGLGDLRLGRFLGGTGVGGLKLVVGTTPHGGRHRNAPPLKGRTVDPNQRNRRGSKRKAAALRWARPSDC